MNSKHHRGAYVSNMQLILIQVVHHSIVAIYIYIESVHEWVDHSDRDL